MHPYADRLATQPTTALFKSEQLEVIRLVLRAGKSLPPHDVAGEITVHCLEGELEVTFNGRAERLAPGQMLFLARAVPHAVTAIEDASALVTIVVAK